MLKIKRIGDEIFRPIPNVLRHCEGGGFPPEAISYMALGIASSVFVFATLRSDLLAMTR